jgi:hypothetical protein
MVKQNMPLDAWTTLHMHKLELFLCVTLIHLYSYWFLNFTISFSCTIPIHPGRKNWHQIPAVWDERLRSKYSQPISYIPGQRHPVNETTHLALY